MTQDSQSGFRKPDWFHGTADAWADLFAVAGAILAKERLRRQRLVAGLASSATLIVLGGIGLSQTVQAQGTAHNGSLLTTAVLMLIVFVVVGGFQTLRYLEQHALDINDERRLLDLARCALQAGEIDTAATGEPQECAVTRLVRREAARIRAAEQSARRLAPALWGAGLTTTSGREYN
jgi:uncharacterized membrane protein YhiD involved in acid resistance